MKPTEMQKTLDESKTQLERIINVRMNELGETREQAQFAIVQSALALSVTSAVMKHAFKMLRRVK